MLVTEFSRERHLGKLREWFTKRGRLDRFEQLDQVMRFGFVVEDAEERVVLASFIYEDQRSPYMWVDIAVSDPDRSAAVAAAVPLLWKRIKDYRDEKKGFLLFTTNNWKIGKLLRERFGFQREEPDLCASYKMGD